MQIYQYHYFDTCYAVRLSYRLGVDCLIVFFISNNISPPPLSRPIILIVLSLGRFEFSHFFPIEFRFFCDAARTNGRTDERRLRDDTGHDQKFDRTKIVSPEDFEETAVAPVRVPRVHRQPVLVAVFDTPSDQFDVMVSHEIAAGRLVNTCSNTRAPTAS